jgi:excisionase family DNA binding protein
VTSDSQLALALVAALDDRALDALADRLRPRLRGDTTPEPRPIAYTVATLADEVGLSQRAVRAAIHRGELQASLRGRSYLITASAVEAWAAPSDRAASARRESPSRKPRRRGVMTSALAQLDMER